MRLVPSAYGLLYSSLTPVQCGFSDFIIRGLWELIWRRPGPQHRQQVWTLSRRLASCFTTSIAALDTISFELAVSIHEASTAFGLLNYIQFIGVTAEDLALIDNERTSRRSRIRIKRYYAKHGLLLIAIPTAFHELSHANLYMEIATKIARMGLDDQWTGTGATTHETAAGDMGEADSTGRPRFTRRGHDSWPTLVIESGVSDSLQALRDDMRWWFSASDHQVKIVILVKLDVTERHIILEKYRGIQSAAERPGATMTRAATARQLEPVLDQTIHITQTTGDPMNDTSYIVTGDALRLEFALLFLREPVPEDREHDVTIEMPDLQTLASKIWGGLSSRRRNS
jgi:hypothetical protein